MNDNEGSILVPLVILMVIGAVGATYVSHYLSTSAQQAYGVKQSHEAALRVNQQMELADALLGIAHHDVSRLPPHVASSVVHQNKSSINDLPVTTTTINIAKTSPAPAMANYEFVQYPWMKRLPEAPIISRHTINPVISISVNLVPPQPGSLPPVAIHKPTQALDTWLFSAPDAQVMMSQHIDDCSTLDTTARGSYLITNDCEIPENMVVGTPESPVLLIIKNADFWMGAGSQINGLVLSDADSDITVSRIKMGKKAIVMGALMINHKLLPGSALNIAYRPQLLKRLQVQPSLQLHHPVAGTWRDF